MLVIVSNEININPYPANVQNMVIIIPKFIEGSTCFECHTAHHQELQTVFAASGLYTHVVTGRGQGLTTAGHHMGI